MDVVPSTYLYIQIYTSILFMIYLVFKFLKIFWRNRQFREVQNLINPWNVQTRWSDMQSRERNKIGQPHSSWRDTKQIRFYSFLNYTVRFRTGFQGARIHVPEQSSGFQGFESCSVPQFYSFRVWGFQSSKVPGSQSRKDSQRSKILDFHLRLKIQKMRLSQNEGPNLGTLVSGASRKHFGTPLWKPCPNAEKVRLSGNVSRTTKVQRSSRTPETSGNPEEFSSERSTKIRKVQKLQKIQKSSGNSKKSENSEFPEKFKKIRKFSRKFKKFRKFRKSQKVQKLTKKKK